MIEGIPPKVGKELAEALTQRLNINRAAIEKAERGAIQMHAELEDVKRAIAEMKARFEAFGVQREQLEAGQSDASEDIGDKMVSEAMMAAEQSIREGIDALNRLAEWFEDVYKRQQATLEDLKAIQITLLAALPADPNRKQ